MKQLRLFLSRVTFARQCLLLLIFTVLLSRALLSSVVMLDPDAPTGSFGLVICSGQGPLFSQNGSASMHATTQMDDGTVMNMGAMTTSSNMPHDNSTAPPIDDSQDAGKLCLFSGAFLQVIAHTAFMLLFFGLVVVVRRWTFFIESLPFKPRRHRRPPSRAPPLFA